MERLKAAKRPGGPGASCNPRGMLEYRPDHGNERFPFQIVEFRKRVPGDRGCLFHWALNLIRIHARTEVAQASGLRCGCLATLWVAEYSLPKNETTSQRLVETGTSRRLVPLLRP